MKLKIQQSPNALIKTGIALIAASTLLTGCGNSDDNIVDEATASSPISEPSTAPPTQYIPASEDGPAQNVPEPQMPDLVKEQTVSGAEATLEYFWETYQYLRETGDTSYLEDVSTTDCEICIEARETWVRPHEANNKWLGLHGDFAVQDIDLISVYAKTATSPLTWAQYSFKVIEPPTDAYLDGRHLRESSFSEPSTSHWQAELMYNEDDQIWLLDWAIQPDNWETE